jgi:ABC-type lipoprotein release transport system permease subunit
MADYNIKVLTPSGQFRDVIVRDFVYSADAERAALSQTGGGQVRSVSPYFDKPEEVSSSNGNYSHSRNDAEWDTSNWWDDDGNLTSEGKLSQFIIFTIIPTLVCIAIHPIVAILWNVGFSKMWFGWKFWFQ